MPAEDYGKKVIVDATTGKLTQQALSAAEVAERDALAAEAAQKANDEAAAEGERKQRRARLQAALDGGGLDALSEDLVREVLDS